MLAGVRVDDLDVSQLVQGRVRQGSGTGARRVSLGASGARAARVPVRHVLLGGPADAEEHRGRGPVQSDGRLVGNLLHRRFDGAEDVRVRRARTSFATCGLMIL